MMTREQEQELKAAAHKHLKLGWKVGVAVLLKDGRVWSHGYQRDGYAFNWANRQFNQGAAVAGFIEGIIHPFWRFEPEDGWEGC